MQNKYLLKFVSLALLLILLIPGAANAGTGENRNNNPVSQERKRQIIKSIEEHLHTLKTLRAEFIQERHVALFLDVLKSKGLLYFERPDKLRWELTEPYRTIMLFNDRNVAKFRIEKGKMDKASVGMEDLLRGVLGQIISILKGDFGNSMEAYNMEVFEGENYLLRLLPKSERMAESIQTLELYFDKKTLNMSQIIIREPQNDFMKIIFSNQRINETLNNELFNLENPAYQTRAYY